ncbi:hypothetical protein SAMN04488128_105554 [Chitinophaga eiseniae]|uniref:Leucine rich repeat-containing protein n=1 Tax=Chitinophaga eiseniae TaxID=634771 RepID=A0A1T4TP44_9BACT|nr:hypothetical protein [Chitinophaga eiseniae]SKA41949.1 hypothetical protein SAMN04488128_105554 [Chitinophaga eiseniae]
MMVDIEINSAKDMDVLKTYNTDEIDTLNLYIYASVSLKFIPKLKNLKSLLIAGSVKDLSPVSQCKSLTTLMISNKGAVNTLDFLQELSLETLKLESFTSKIDHLTFPVLPSLRNVEISGVAKINDLAFLEDFSAIEKISLFELNAQRLFDFSTLHQLKELRLTNMFHLKALSELATVNAPAKIYIREFYINRKIKNDKKEALLKVLPELKQLDVIELSINQEKFSKDDLLGMLRQ